MDGLIDRENPQKLYIQLTEIIKNKMLNKEWPVGTQIPTEEELCAIYGISKATVRTAIMELVRQGYLKRQQGRGTFVSKKVISEGLAMITSFREMMVEAGVEFSTTVLAQTVMMPTDDLDAKLGVSEDKHIVYIKRLRAVESDPVLLQESYIPHHICPQILTEDVEHNSIFELFEKKYGIKITNVKGYIEIAYLTKEEAGHLGLEPGSAALLLTQHFFSGETQVMYSRSVKRPDRFRFSIELEKKA